tara:strand:- start:335 stop:1135 length:801 start_codon:yes stop_codon:yes gene_type:complete
MNNLEINKIYNESNLDTMVKMPNDFIDLTVTSPPYDDLRDYNGYSFDFESIAKELFRVTKDGGVVVWVVGDATIKGSETGTSFKQALYGIECGFRLHDTMIYKKNSYPFPPSNRYYQQFEYMFVFSKGSPKSFNGLKQDTKWRKSQKEISTTRQKDGSTKEMKYAKGKSKRLMDNVWDLNTGYMRSTKDKVAYQHSAIFPEQLANDHIISWSNENDLVYDPFMGSGTTAKMAKLNNRNYIGSEISKEYCNIANERLKPYLDQQTLF